MATVEDILATFRDFTESPDGQDLYVAQADAELASAEFFNTDDDDRNWAVAYKAADMMVQAGLGTVSAQAGAVTARRIGNLSISYSQPTTANGAAPSNPYGRLFMEWVAARLMTPRTSYG